VPARAYEGHNVFRVADVGQDRADDYQIFQTAINPQKE
jgi:hypothetical protein